MSLKRKIIIIAILSLCVIATCVYLFRYAPLTMAQPLYPVSGMAEVRIKGYLQEMALGPYMLWDENCNHSTTAVLSKDLKDTNQDTLKKLDLNRVPANERTIAGGVYYGKIKQFKLIRPNTPKPNQVYIAIYRMEIEKITTVDKEFADLDKCEIEHSAF